MWRAAAVTVRAAGMPVDVLVPVRMDPPADEVGGGPDGDERGEQEQRQQERHADAIRTRGHQST